MTRLRGARALRVVEPHRAVKSTVPALAALVVWTVWAAPAQASDCEDPITLVEEAERATLLARFEAARTALTKLEAAWACSPIAEPKLLARQWLTEGVLSSIRGDVDTANDAFGAAARLDPSGWNPDYGPDMQMLFDAASERAPQMGEILLQPALEGWVAALDGAVVPFPARVASGLHLVQIGPQDGDMLFSQVVFLQPADRLVVDHEIDPPTSQAPTVSSSVLIPHGPGEPLTACDTPTTIEALDAALASNRTAFATLNTGALTRTANEASHLADCLRAPLTPEHAAAIFRAHGFAAYASSDTEAAWRQFHAAAEILPSYVMPEATAAANHPVRQLYVVAASEPPSRLFSLAEPQDGWLQVDGQRSLMGNASRVWLVQLFEDDGTVVATRFMTPGSAPAYPTHVAAPPRAPTSRVLAVTAGGTALLAGASALGAGLLRRQYNQAPVTDGELTGVIKANRITGYSSFSLLGVATGLGVTAVAMGRW